MGLPSSSLPDRPGTLRRFCAHVCRAVPPVGPALAGAALWAAIMAASATHGIWLRTWQTPYKVQAVALLFAVGGAVGFPVGLFLARLFGMGRRREAAFAAALIGFSAATVASTALAYALVYRSYYAAWHAEPLSLTWLFQLIFTTLGATGQFAVLGLRLYFPIGFAAMLAAALWFVRKPR
ncbi:hypothetical protein MesoLjLc_54590 [Mesorhizobium sp. L-8-10]|nr:hypothetical protein MesoLjLb_53140 [Mesorhizobium sp. L-8-3]BCH33529.1 hypothetical protein MesoLjLc_54590 [Mesorhizobium sp. L-8-10]